MLYASYLLPQVSIASPSVKPPLHLWSQADCCSLFCFLSSYMYTFCSTTILHSHGFVYMLAPKWTISHRGKGGSLSFFLFQCGRHSTNKSLLRKWRRTCIKPSTTRICHTRGNLSKASQLVSWVIRIWTQDSPQSPYSFSCPLSVKAPAECESEDLWEDLCTAPSPN